MLDRPARWRAGASEHFAAHSHGLYDPEPPRPLWRLLKVLDGASELEDIPCGICAPKSGRSLK
jgi:hypothetical protein